MKIDGDDLVKAVIISEVLSEDPPPAQGPPTQPVPGADLGATGMWISMVLFGVLLALLLGVVVLVWQVVAWISGGGRAGS